MQPTATADRHLIETRRYVPNELIRPIDENTARAIEELSKTTGKGLDVVARAGGYAADVVGRTPHNLIAFLFGDRLAHFRIRQLARLQQRTREILSQRGVEEAEENPSVEIPLLEAAIDEGRDELLDVWAKLWAAAMDPSRKGSVRRSLIDVVKKMEPVDAIVFDICAREARRKGRLGLTAQNFKIDFKIDFSQDEIIVSIGELGHLGLLSIEGSSVVGYIGPLGRLLAAAVVD
jgi:hypothetical protein